MWVKLPYRFSKTIFSMSSLFVVLHTISFLFVRLPVSCSSLSSIRFFFYQEKGNGCIVFLAFCYCFLLAWKYRVFDKKGQFLRVLFEECSILFRLQLLGDNFVLWVYYPSPCTQCTKTGNVLENSAVLCKQKRSQRKYDKSRKMRKKFEEKKTNINEAAAAAAVGDFCLFNISI